MVTDMDRQLEIFRHKKYRKMRVRFYGLVIFAVALTLTLIGFVVISNQPIDVSNVKNAETAYEVAYAEYGDTYIKTLNNLPTIGYESQYKALKSTYLDLLEDGGSEKDKNKIALDLIVFVEYVQTDAVNTAQRYGLSGVSQQFYEAHQEYMGLNGEVHETLVTLVESHVTPEGKLSEDKLMSIIKDLDSRIELYTGYLTTLKNT